MIIVINNNNKNNNNIYDNDDNIYDNDDNNNKLQVMNCMENSCKYLKRINI